MMNSSSRPALVNLATILFRPRATIRRILDHRPDRMVIPLILLALVSEVASELNVAGLQEAFDARPEKIIAMIAVGSIVGSVVVVAMFYLASLVVLAVGRFLEGTGEAAAVRSALAWGLAPFIWAIVYRLPAALWIGPMSDDLEVHVRGEELILKTPEVASGCGTALVFGLLEAAVLVWSIALMSNTLAEAHRFSTWRGVGTLALSAVAPAVIVIAAILAIVF